MCKHALLGICILLTCLSVESSCRAGILDKIAREAAEAAARSTGKELLEQGSKSAARQVANEAAEAAVRNTATRTVIRFSDDAVGLTGSRAAALTLADDAAIVTGKLSSQNARRLVMMADDIEKSGKTPELMRLLAKNAAADQVIEFLWRNKATIASGALLTTVIANPEIITEATSRVGESIVETAGREIVHPLTGGSMFGAWTFVIIGVFVIVGALSIWLRPRIWRRLAAWAIVASAK